MLSDELPKKGHAEHSMSDNAIQADTVRSLFIKMNRIVIAGCIGIALKLFPGNRWLHKWRKFFTDSCAQNAHLFASAYYVYQIIDKSLEDGVHDAPHARASFNDIVFPAWLTI